MFLALFFSLIASVTIVLLKPKATIRFPTGEVTLEEKEDEEVPRKLLINGILKGPILNGVGAAHYTDEELRLRYSYKVILFVGFMLIYLLISYCGLYKSYSWHISCSTFKL